MQVSSAAHVLGKVRASAKTPTHSPALPRNLKDCFCRTNIRIDSISTHQSIPTTRLSMPKLKDVTTGFNGVKPYCSREHVCCTPTAKRSPGYGCQPDNPRGGALTGSTHFQRCKHP